jgi:hypothetical protein
MTHIEQAIRDAVMKGEYKRRHYRHSDYTEEQQQLVDWPMERILLDPAFWQALGKARGWKMERDCPDLCHQFTCPVDRRHWSNYWHLFIAHLADGKDAESFFASLTSSSV